MDSIISGGQGGSTGETVGIGVRFTWPIQDFKIIVRQSKCPTGQAAAGRFGTIYVKKSLVVSDHLKGNPGQIMVEFRNSVYERQ